MHTIFFAHTQNTVILYAFFYRYENEFFIRILTIFNPDFIWSTVSKRHR